MKAWTQIFFISSLILSCSTTDTPVNEIEWSNEISTQFNKENAKEEEIDIKLYLTRKPDWKMSVTGSGLQYYIYESHPKNPLAVVGNKVEAQFRVELLDGELVGESKADEVTEFEVDRAQIETGIQEAVKLMRQGERAKLIIPSHLAHGVVGDLSKIPPLSVLVVDIYVHRIY